MPSTAEIASGTDDRDLLRALLRVAARAGVEPRELARVLKLGDESPAGPGGSRARCPRAARAAAARARRTAIAIPSTVSVAASPRDRASSPSRSARGTRRRARGRCRGRRRGTRRRSRGTQRDPDRGRDDETVRIGSASRATASPRTHGRLYAWLRSEPVDGLLEIPSRCRRSAVISRRRRARSRRDERRQPRRHAAARGVDRRHSPRVGRECGAVPPRPQKTAETATSVRAARGTRPACNAAAPGGLTSAGTTRRSGRAPRRS